MNTAFRSACLSAAAIATLYGVSPVQARSLQWDPTGTSAPLGADGDGNWNTTEIRWVDKATGTNTAFADGDDVTIGLGGNTVLSATYNVLTLTSNVTVGNITFNPSAAGNPYAIIDSGNGTETFTLNGGIVKNFATNNNTGTNRIQLSKAMVLSAGNHVVSLADTGGDVAGGELTINNELTGTGSLELNNRAAGAQFEQFGTMVLLGANTYTGGTTVSSGRLIINNNAGLGTGNVTVSEAGFLALGGPGAAVSGGLTFTNPLTITRSDYGSGNDFNKYTSAFGSANGSGVHTLSGPITLDTTEGRFRADTSRINITSDLIKGANVASTIFAADGDGAGFINLSGNNAAIAGIRILGGVTLEFASEANIGGPTSSITINGGYLRPLNGAITSFGNHTVNQTTFNGGFSIDENQTFTVDKALGDPAVAAGQIGKRGLGTLNLNSTINLRGGKTFWDSGVVNVNAPVTVNGVLLRSPTVNINSGGILTTSNAGNTGVNGYSSLGTDATGTNGGPDIAVMNVNGTGIINAGDYDFNISDNNNTQGTLNLNDQAQVNVLGTFYAAKSSGTVANLTLNGTSRLSIGGFDATTGAVTAARNFVIARGAAAQATGPVGTVTNNGGTIRVAGEMQIGADIKGVGSYTQTAGSLTVNNWFSTGRFGAQGTTDISGGTVTKNGGNAAYVGENNNAVTSTFTLRGASVYNQTVGGGEFWVGQGGGVGILNISDTASFTVNNWLAVARANINSRGTVNMSGGSFTKPVGSPGFFAIGAGGTGIFNQTGGTLNVSGARIGEANNGTGTLNHSAGTATFVGEYTIGSNPGTTGTVNVSGTANVTAPDIRFGPTAATPTNVSSVGTINLDGGTLTANSIAVGTGVGGAPQAGAKVLNLNGGTLRPLNDNVNFVGPNVVTVIGAGGGKIDSNGKVASINAPLTQASGVTGTLAKSGLGTIRLNSTAASSYTGRTTVSGGGTLAANTANYNAVILGGGGATLVGGLSGLSLDYTGGSSPVAAVRTLLAAGYAQPTKFSSGQISATLTGNETVGYGDSGTAVNVLVTLPGDATLNGSVSFDDFVTLQGNFGQSNATFAQGDFNYNGVVTFDDFVLLQGNFGQAVTPGARAAFTREQYAAVMSITDASQVPEPAALTAIGAAAALLGGPSPPHAGLNGLILRAGVP